MAAASSHLCGSEDWTLAIGHGTWLVIWPFWPSCHLHHWTLKADRRCSDFWLGYWGLSWLKKRLKCLRLQFLWDIMYMHIVQKLYIFVNNFKLKISLCRASDCHQFEAYFLHPNAQCILGFKLVPLLVSCSFSAMFWSQPLPDYCISSCQAALGRPRFSAIISSQFPVPDSRFATSCQCL